MIQPQRLRIALAQFDFPVGDVAGNAARMAAWVAEARDVHGADLVLFPELALSGYPPEDLLLRPAFLAACEAAFRHGGDWHRELIAYLRGNRDRVAATMASLPGVRMAPVEATYLAWIDARGMEVENPAKHFEEKAGLFLSDGAFFGWPGFVRFNFGCPRERMMEGLEKMAKAL